jgi:hypothetical protein
MSYFKSSNNTSINNTICNNSDLYKRKTFVSSASVKPVVYSHQDNQFPDLFVATNLTKSLSNDYVKAAVTVSAVKSVVKAYEVPSGATQYTFHKATGKTTVTLGKTTVTLGKTTVTLGKTSKSDLENVGETILKELSYNWKRYKKDYDELHGPNAYDDLYHTEPIYPYLDEEFFVVE